MTEDKTQNKGADDTTKKNDGDDTTKGGDKGEQTIPKASYDVVAEKLRKANEKIAQIEEAQKKAEQKKLEDDGKFKELAEQAQQEAEGLRKQLSRSAKVNAITAEALKLGTVDVDAVIALSNIDGVEVLEDGTVDASTVSKLVADLKEAKPYLFGEKSQANIGNKGGAPEGTGEKPVFKRSQLRDGNFYEKNKDAIELAYKEGRIVDDIGNTTAK